MNPCSHLRLVLSEARWRDYDFDEAWTIAMRSLPRNHPEIDDWRTMFVMTRPFWEAAFYNAENPRTFAESQERERLKALAAAEPWAA